jgi:hypothetical protein
MDLGSGWNNIGLCPEDRAGLIPDHSKGQVCTRPGRCDLGSAATLGCICKKLKMDTMSIDYYRIILYSDIIWLK